MNEYNLYKSAFFDFSSPMTAWEVIKMIILIPLVPVRILLVLILLIIVASMNSVALLGWRHTEPLPRWRRAIVEASRVPARLILTAFGVSVKIDGWENVQKAYDIGAIGIFNHTSYFDALVVFSLLVPSGVARQATENSPLIGRCIRPLQNIYVPENRRGSNRKGAAGGAADDSKDDKAANNSNGTSTAATEQTTNGESKAPTITDLIIKRVNDPRYAKPGGFPLLMIAPEGTVGNGQNLLPFKAGAFVPSKPVLPVIFDYTANKNLNLAWTEFILPFHILRTMCQFVNYLHIRILEVHFPTEEEKASPTTYADNMRAVMAADLKVGLTDDAFANCKKVAALGIKVGCDGRTILDPHNLVRDGVVDLDTPAPATKKTQ